MPCHCILNLYTFHHTPHASSPGLLACASDPLCQSSTLSQSTQCRPCLTQSLKPKTIHPGALAQPASPEKIWSHLLVVHMWRIQALHSPISWFDRRPRLPRSLDLRSRLTSNRSPPSSQILFLFGRTVLTNDPCKPLGPFDNCFRVSENLRPLDLSILPKHNPQLPPFTHALPEVVQVQHIRRHIPQHYLLRQPQYHPATSSLPSQSKYKKGKEPQRTNKDPNSPNASTSSSVILPPPLPLNPLSCSTLHP